MILLDSNILIRHASTKEPAFSTVDRALNMLHTSGEVLCVVPQNVYEFWAAASRPIDSNGLGLSIQECQVQIGRIVRLFRFLSDLPNLFAEWESLVGLHSCHGRVSYDARLVAAMRTHGLTRLLTFNGSDFARFPGVTILDPTSLAAPASPPDAPH